VPFLIRAGKALDERLTQISIRFKAPVPNIFAEHETMPAGNELVIRIQPDEGLFLRITSKVPGLDLRLDSCELDLSYKAKFAEPIPEAYERLLLDVIVNDKTLFTHADELAAAWDVLTPVLKQLEQAEIAPLRYGFGSQGPAAADALAAAAGTSWA
jgi:glucose-6-phosphate 1-dehydrogenase